MKSHFLLLLLTMISFSVYSQKQFEGSWTTPIPLTFNDLTENQKNEIEKEKIGEIEKFKSLVESLRK